MVSRFSNTTNPYRTLHNDDHHVPAARTILAFDLGKYKSVACAYDADTTLARFDILTASR